MNEYELLVDEFHEKFGHARAEYLDNNLLSLRMKLIKEECEELDKAIEELKTIRSNEEFSTDKKYKNAVAHFLKELTDLQYVLSGTVVAFDLPMQEAFKRVHESNLSKLDENGKVIYREDGKVLKGPNYKEPFLDDLALDVIGM